MQIQKSICLLVVVFVYSNFVQTSIAQDRRERRRAIVEDLLRVLVESGQESREAFDFRNRGPAKGRQVELVVPPTKIKPNGKMVELRRYVKNLQSEADLLITDLRNQGATIPQLRPMLADAIHVRAQLDLFGKRCQRFSNIEPLREDFLQLDHRWRTLNHQLRHVPSISRQCIACLDKVHGHHQRVCQVLEIEPQIDRQRLGQLATEFHADIKHLNRDLYYEFSSHPNLRGMLQTGQLLQNQVVQYAPLIRRGNYDSIVAAYKQCRKTWREFSNKVCTLPSERLRHDVARIEDLGHEFMEELWLTPELDREYIGNMCSWVDLEMNKILQQITLADLLQCKNPAAVLAAAKSFQSRCETFSNSIGAGVQFEQLVPEYRLFEESWNVMDTQCRVLKKQGIVSRLDEVKYTISRFQPIFGTGPAISDDLMIRLAADWSQLADQINLQVSQFDAAVYDKNTYRELCNRCENMSRKVRRLCQLVENRSRKKYQAHLNDCFEQWREVKRYLNKCTIEHRRLVARSRNQVEPLIAKLQLAFTDF